MSQGRCCTWTQLHTTENGEYRRHIQRGGERASDAASELLRDILGKDKMSARLVFGVESLPLGTLIELEAIFEVSVVTCYVWLDWSEKLIRDTLGTPSFW
jgi:hypothetical protein